MSGNSPGSAPPHGGEGHAGGAEQLVKMANDIGHYFHSEPVREEAIAGIANHIDKYWTRRMREKLSVHLKNSGDAVLDELPREAVRRLFARQAATARPAAH